MKTTPATIGRRSPWSHLETGLFFLLFYLYVWLVTDPRLIHHSLGILTVYRPFSFHAGWPFFVEHLARVGGLVEYGLRLCTQCYAWGWAGALIITAVACCAGYFAQRLSRRAGSPRGRVLGYAAAAVVLVMHDGCSHPLRPILALLTALGGFSLYVRFAPRSPIPRMVAFLLAFLMLYHLAGAGSVIFPVLVAVDELLLERRKAVAVVALVCGGVVPWTAGTWFGVEPAKAYGSFLVSDAGVSLGRWPHTLALYLLFPTALAGTALWGAARVRAGAPRAQRDRRRGIRSSPTESRHSLAGRLLTWPVAAAAGLAILGVLAWCSLHSFTRTMLEIDYCSQQGQWGAVLRTAGRLPRDVYHVRCERNILLALYHLGRLGDEMCRYALKPTVDLFCTPERHQDLGSYYQESRLLLDIGQVNEAEKCAFEALETSGDQPAVLEQLATISMVKGRPETARVFLRALARNPFQRRSAQALRGRLDTDPGLEHDAQVSQLRANAVDQDRVVRPANLEAFLIELLEKNPRNRLAFELLMAHYLAAGRLERVAENLGRLKDFSYRTVPRHYQEAWLIHAGFPDRPPPIPGFALDPEVVRAAQEFRRITARAAGAQDAAQQAWVAGLGDSYFLYYLANGSSGR